MVDRLIVLVIIVMMLVGAFFSASNPFTFFFGAIFSLAARELVTMK